MIDEMTPGTTTPESLLETALSNYMQGDLHAAGNDLDALLECEPDSVKANWFKAIVHFGPNDADEPAASCLARAFASYLKSPVFEKPTEMSITEYIAELLLTVKDIDGFLAGVPISWQGYWSLALTLAERGLYEDGLKYSSKAFETANYPRAKSLVLVDRAYIYSLMGKPEQMLSTSLQAEEIEPESQCARFTKAGAYLSLRQPEVAAEEYSYVIENSPKLAAEARLERGVCYFLMERYPEAIVDLSTESTHYKLYSRFPFCRAIALCRIGAIESAVDALCKYLELKPECQVGYMLRAELYEHLAQKDLLRAGLIQEDELSKCSENVPFPFTHNPERLAELLSFARALADGMSTEKYRNRQL